MFVPTVRVRVWFPVALALALGSILLAAAASFGGAGADLAHADPAAPEQSVIVEPIAHFGGRALTGAAQGDFAFVGQGLHLATLDMRQASLNQIADVALAAAPQDLALAGNWAYVAADPGFGIVDISQPLSPSLASTLALRSLAVEVSGTRAYIAGPTGLSIVNVTDPYSPTLIGALSGLDLYKLALAGRYAYAIEDRDGVPTAAKLRVIDVTNPTAPVVTGSLVITGARSVFVQGSYAYVPETSSRTLRIISVADPAHPRQVGVFDPRVDGARQWPYEVAVAGNYAYLACSERLFIVNVADPAQPVEAGRLETPGIPIQIQATAPYVYLTVNNVETFRVINVANPASPTVEKTWRSPSSLSWAAAAGRYLYVAADLRLWIYDASALASPVAGSRLTALGSVAIAFGAPDAGQPSLVGVYPWGLNRLVVQGNVLYGTTHNTLTLLDVSDPYSPTLLAVFQPLMSPPMWVPFRLAVQGRYAYLARGELQIVDVANPRAPQALGAVALPGTATGIAVAAPATATLTADATAGNAIAYVPYSNDQTGARGVQLVNLSAPISPTLALTLPTLGLPTAIWVEGARLYVGSSGSAHPPYAPWSLEAYDIANPAAPVRVGQTGGNEGGIMDLQVWGDRLYAAVWGSGVHVLAADTLQEAALGRGGPAAQMALLPPTASGSSTGADRLPKIPTRIPTRGLGVGDDEVPTVAVAQGYRYFGGTSDIDIFSVEGVELYRFPPPPPSCGVTGKVMPQQAAAAGCTIAPVSAPCRCGDPESRITFSASQTCRGWGFRYFSNANPLPCPASGTAEQVAWFGPSLTVGGGGTTDLCLSATAAERKNLTALTFNLCASDAVDWEVSKVTLQASGSGNDQTEIEKVQLKHRGATLGGPQTYPADNGKLSFSFPLITIPQAGCETFTLLYDLKDLGPCTASAKEFRVTVQAGEMAAEPKEVGLGTKSGTASGGVIAACVWNENTHTGYDLIQPAVSAAADGHTIAVCPGNYTENVDVTRSLTVKSTRGRDETSVAAATAADHVFEVKANKSTIQGFTIRGATGNNKAGIYLGSASAALSGEVLADSTASPAAGSSECKVLGNMLQGNRYGVFIVGASKNQIGGTAEVERNVISGNNGDGVRISGAGASENKVLGNRIGTDVAGTGSLGNGGSGVWIGNDASRNIIGGLDVTPGAPCANSCNVIAYNVQDGVTVMAGTGNAIQGNSIHSNTKLGIDLAGDGWTRNGKTGDAAPNNWQNYPIITGTLTLADRTVITGSLTARANTTYRLEFFTNTSCETTGLIQGRELLATAEVATNADGQAQFRITAPRAVHNLTATATDPDGNTSEFSPPDIQVSAIEVTQAIQNLAHEVPLIAEKPTTARVYVRAVGCDAPQVTAVLRGPQGGLNPVNRQPLTAQALAEPQRPTAQERARFDDSLNFNLPPSWIGAGTYTWTAEVNPECQRPDADCGEANRFQLRNITFRPGGQLTPVLIPIRYVRDGVDLRPDQSEFKPYVSYLRLYPLAMNPLTYYIDPPVNFSGDLRTLAGWESLLDTLWLSNLLIPNPGPNARYYGVVDELVPVGAVKGIARLPGGLSAGKYKFAAGRADPAYGHWVMIHEVAHTFGRLHPGCTADEAQPDPTWPAAYNVCNIGVTGADGHYGFDYSYQYAISPEDRADFMTYTFLPNNGSLPVWVSPHTYQGLHAALTRTAAQAAAAPLISTHGFLAVRGSVSLKTDAGSFDTVYRFSETNLDYVAGAGPYTLALEDASGQALVSHAFDLYDPHLAADTETAHFAELIPFDPRAARLALRRGGSLLAVRNFSPHSPVVTLLYPNGGENLSGVITVRWTASDADGDPLSQIVQLSCDDGATWRGLAVNVPGSSLLVNTADLPGGQACRFRVMSSDGVNTGQDQSDGVFTIGRKPPSALIIAPTDGAAPLAGAALTLQGAGSDPEEGPLGDAALSWRDSVSGTLGAGAQLVLPEGLGLGWHTLTLTAADSDGMTGSDSVRICVGCPQADLKLTKTAAPAPAQTGQPLTYTLVIANAGPDPATGATLTDTLPAGVTVGPVAISQGTCNVAAGVVACNVGEVAAGATVTATVVVTPTQPGALTNRALVRCNEGDPTSDNTAAVTTEVTGAPARIYLPLIAR